MKVSPADVELDINELSTHIVVLYDGVCGLCNRLNRFLIKRDRRDRFRFAPLQSQFASQVLRRHGVEPARLDTIYVVYAYERRDESLWAKGIAISKLLREIGGVWGVAASGFAILPHRLRDRLYDLVAGHRYQLFGKYETCPMPLPQDRKRFIEV